MPQSSTEDGGRVVQDYGSRVLIFATNIGMEMLVALRNPFPGGSASSYSHLCSGGTDDTDA